jgi:hypothetical protein
VPSWMRRVTPDQEGTATGLDAVDWWRLRNGRKYTPADTPDTPAHYMECLQSAFMILHVFKVRSTIVWKMSRTSFPMTASLAQVLFRPRAKLTQDRTDCVSQGSSTVSWIGSCAPYQAYRPVDNASDVFGWYDRGTSIGGALVHCAWYKDYIWRRVSKGLT